MTSEHRCASCVCNRDRGGRVSCDEPTIAQDADGEEGSYPVREDIYLLCSAGRVGIFKVPLCVEVAWLPSGKVTVIGVSVIRTSDMAALSFKAMKWPVVPVSAFAIVLMTGRLMVCGIKASEIICFCLGLEKNTFARLTTLSTSIPPHQHRLLPLFL